MGLTRIRADQISNIDYKQAVRVITLTNITSLTTGAPLIVDGVTLVVGDRVLVTAQSTASQNGIYIVSSTGTGSNGNWVRASDANATGDLEAGTIVMVTDGSSYADTSWKLITDDPIVIGTSDLTFLQNTGNSFNIISTAASNVAANGVSGTVTFTAGNNFSVVGNNASDVITFSVVDAPSFVGNVSASYFIGNGSLLTGVATSYGNAEVAAYLPTYTGNLLVGNVNNANGNGVGNIGNSTNYFDTVFAKATSAQYADLAEMYCADAAYPPGTVLEFGGEREVTITTVTHTAAAAGIVSTHPSYLMNSTLDCVNAVELALVGRVPCQVVGTIRKGDRLVASKIPGVATALNMALYEPGCIVGKSLEDYNSTEVGIIEVAVGRF